MHASRNKDVLGIRVMSIHLKGRDGLKVHTSPEIDPVLRFDDDFSAIFYFMRIDPLNGEISHGATKPKIIRWQQEDFGVFLRNERNSLVGVFGCSDCCIQFNFVQLLV